MAIDQQIGFGSCMMFHWRLQLGLCSLWWVYPYHDEIRFCIQLSELALHFCEFWNTGYSAHSIDKFWRCGPDWKGWNQVCKSCIVWYYRAFLSMMNLYFSRFGECDYTVNGTWYDDLATDPVFFSFSCNDPPVNWSSDVLNVIAVLSQYIEWRWWWNPSPRYSKRTIISMGLFYLFLWDHSRWW